MLLERGVSMARFQNIKPAITLTGWYQSVRQDRFFWLFFGVWLIPIIFSLIYTAVSFSNLPSQIPLFYSRLWGQSQLANNPYIFLPLVGTLLLGLFNFSVGASYHNRRPVLSYLLEGTAAVISLLAAITIFNIVNLMR